jgi:peptidoglycan/LPS O-acetylase OafA/YrhL
MMKRLTRLPRPSGEVRRRSDKHRPALDGIRAIAVLAVMLYHGLVTWSRGGFLGVDVFFVLSGYLITSLLLTEWRRWGSIDLVRFYLRRARRLLPALVLVVMAVAAWASFTAKPDRLGTIRADGLSTLLYVANWRFVVARQSYFDQFGDPSPFRHMWSLAIEEQYYLLFPLLLIGLLRLARIRQWLLPAALGGMTLASIAAMAMLYDPSTDPSRVYYGTDTRMHELLIGSLLAVALNSAGAWRERAVRLGPYVGGVGMAGVLASCYWFTDQSKVLYLGGFAGVCVVSAALIAGVELAPTSPVARILSLSPVAWVGAISYGLYLWHWPIYIALTPDRTGLTGTPLLLVRIAATFAVATASYYLVERPIRNGSLARLPARLGRILATGAMPAALVALVAGTVGAVAPPLEASPFGPGKVTQGRQSLLVVGDSVGDSLVASFPGNTYPNWQVQGSTILGCGLGGHQLSFEGVQGMKNPKCDSAFTSWRSAVNAAQPEAVMLSLGAWEVFDHIVHGQVESVMSQEYANYLTARLQTSYDILTSTGAHLFIPNVPCFAEPEAGELRENFAAIRNDPERAAAVNKVITDFAASHSDTTVIDLSSWLCPGGNYEATRDGIQMRYDGVHFTVAGGAKVWGAVLMPAILNEEGDSRLRVLLVGDSVPLGLFERFPRSNYPELLVRDSTQLGCSSFAFPSVVDGHDLESPDNCQTWADGIPEAIDAFEPAVGMVFVGIGEQFDKRVDDQILTWGTEAHDEWLTTVLKERIDLFREAGAAVVLPTVPCHQVSDSGVDSVAAIINDDARTQANNDLIKQVAAEYAGTKGPAVTVLDLYADLCADGYTDEIDGISLYADGLHFTTAGAAYVWTYLADAAKAVSSKRAN